MLEPCRIHSGRLARTRLRAASLAAPLLLALLGAALMATPSAGATLTPQPWASGPMPAMDDMGVAVVDGTYILMGGLDSSFTPIDTIYLADPAASTFTAAGVTLPIPTVAGTAVAYDGIVYYFGGYDGSFSALDQVLAYDPGSDTITTLPVTLPSARAYMSGVEIGGLIYLFGGEENGGDPGLDDILVFDPSSPMTPPQPSGHVLPYGREATSAVAIGGRAYIFGGDNYQNPGGGPSVDEIVEFDPATGTTTMGATLPHTVGAGLLATGAFTDGTYAYVVGGFEGFDASPLTFHDQILRYDPATDTLVDTGDDLPSPRGFTGVGFYDGTAHIFGGWDGSAFTDQVFNWTDSSGGGGGPGGPSGALTAAFSIPPPPLEPGEVIVFTDRSTPEDEIVSWDWDFGDGNSSILRDGYHAYELPGTYTVTLTVTDEDENTNTTSRTIAVYQLPDGRSDIAAASVGGDYYMLGGRNSTGAVSDILVFDPTTNSLAVVGTLPERSYAGTAVAVDGVIYHFGGWNGSKTLADITRFDPGAGITPMTPMLAPRAYMSGVAIDGLIYLFGGEGDEDDAGTTEILVFDPSSPMTPPQPTGVHLPGGRSGTSAVAMGGKAYIFGGDTYPAGGALDHILEFDPTAATATKLQSRMPEPRTTTTAWTDGLSAYVTGGFESWTADPPARYNQMLRFDGQDQYVVPMTGEILPTRRASVGGATADGLTQLFGGWDETGLLDDVLGWRNPASVQIDVTMPEAGDVCQRVVFNATGSTSQGTILEHRWDFDTSDPVVELPNGEAVEAMVYEEAGTYTARLVIRDDRNAKAFGDVSVTVTEDQTMVDPLIPFNDTYTVEEGRMLKTSMSDGPIDNDCVAPAAFVEAHLVSGPDPDLGIMQEWWPEGGFWYEAPVGYEGPINFTYRLHNGTGFSDQTANISIEVTPRNHAPDAQDLAVYGQEDTPVSFVLPASDEEDGPLDLLYRLPGTVPGLTGGPPYLTYTPAADVCTTGPDDLVTFDFEAIDTQGRKDTGTVRIVLACVDDAPAPGDDHVAVENGTTAFFGGLLSNDEDADIPYQGDTISIASAGLGHTLPWPRAFLAAAGDGDEAYVFGGWQDGTGYTDQAWHWAGPAVDRMTAADWARGPLPSRQGMAVAEAGGVYVVMGGTGPLGAGMDTIYLVDPGTETVTLADAKLPSPRYGGAAVALDGIVYHFGGRNATDTLDDTVAFDPATGNMWQAADLPDDFAHMSAVAIGDSAYIFGGWSDDAGSRQQVLNFTPGDGFTPAGLLPAPREGTSAVAIDGMAYVFGGDARPTPDSMTAEVVAYDPSDYTSTIVGATLPQGRVGTAAWTHGTDAYILGGFEGHTVSSPTYYGDLLRLDTLTGDLVTVDGVGGVTTARGNVSVAGPTTVGYDAPAGFAGWDTFRYAVEDGTGLRSDALVTVSVYNASINTPPEAHDVDAAPALEDLNATIGLSASDAEDHPMVLDFTATDGTPGPVPTELGGWVNFTGDRGRTAVYKGPADTCQILDRFHFLVTDPVGATDTGEVTVAVECANDAPTANDDAYVTAEDESKVLYVLANDTDDVDGAADGLFVVAATQPSHGSVLNAGTHLVYTPGRDETEAVSFDYTVSDGAGGLSTATVNITITPVNDAPVARPTPVLQATEGGPTVSIGVADLATDVDGDALSVQDVGAAPEEFGVTGKAGGTGIEFTPNGTSDTNGDFLVAYSVSDPGGKQVEGTLRVVVAPANDAPVAYPDSGYNATGDRELVVPAEEGVLVNDLDVETPWRYLRANLTTPPQEGWVRFTPGGGFVYMPPAAFGGIDTFWYNAIDPDGGESEPVMVTIHVTHGAGRPRPPPSPADVVGEGSEEPVEPAPDAGLEADWTVPEGGRLVLDAQKPSGRAGLSIHWDQVEGPDVPLDVEATGDATLHAPAIDGDEPLLLRYQVAYLEDGRFVPFRTVTVAVLPANEPPVAVAVLEAEGAVAAGALVRLAGNASHDPDGDTFTYRWRQVSGPPVALSSVSVPRPSFTAPRSEVGASMVFELLVEDHLEAGAPARVRVDVAPELQPLPKPDGFSVVPQPDGSFLFSARRVDGVAYMWDLGDGSTAEGAQYRHRYAQPGAYEVTMTVRDANGFEEERTQTLEIQKTSLPEPVNVAPSRVASAWPWLVVAEVVAGLALVGVAVAWMVRSRRLRAEAAARKPAFRVDEQQDP